MNITLSIVFRCTDCIDKNRPLPPRHQDIERDHFDSLGDAIKHLKEFPAHNVEPQIEVEG